MVEEHLPPGVERTAEGKLVRRVPRVAVDGTEWEEVRYVALTLEEARLHRMDFYDPVRGWIRDGRKPERDRSPQERLADGRTATPNPELMKSSF